MENDADSKSLITIITDLFKTIFRRLVDIFSLAKLEARLAFKTLINISILIFFNVLLLFSTWLCILLTLFCYLISLQFSLVNSALILVALNIGLLLLCIITILVIKKNLFFPATRRQLSKDTAHEELIDEQP